MKRRLLIALLFFVGLTASAQGDYGRWMAIGNGQQNETIGQGAKLQLIDCQEETNTISMELTGFFVKEVSTPRGNAYVVGLPNMARTASAGEPDLPIIGVPLIVSDRGKMEVRIVEAEYVDFEDFEIAPSKGDIPRTTNPATVAYSYGEQYSQDAFFPIQMATLREPYVLRDFRGQNVVFSPFQYNAVSKTLRVYHRMTVEVYKAGEAGNNELIRTEGTQIKVSPDFEEIYQRRFLNFEKIKKDVIGAAKYLPVEEGGDLLIICHDAFMDAMTDFVAWKRTRGINTTIVSTNTTGSSYTAIKNYITSQYNANNDLAYVLLVGDVGQIPGYSYHSGSTIYNGLGDNPYGQIVGNDIYNDIFIGRFSAQNIDQVTTQANRVIDYERNLGSTELWCQDGMGICANTVYSGPNHELEWQHLEFIRNDLIGYGYNNVYQEYYNVSGFSSTTNQISTGINSGVGIVNYCGHGDEMSWESHSPAFSISRVNSLTNDNRLPFIFSAACENGKYDYSSGDCFAEVWMHATNSNTGAATGAIATVMSYIVQPWIPPMYAQDEFNKIIVEAHNGSVKRTMGGIALNSLLSIFDFYDANDASAIGTYQSWILFGDPSLAIRTKSPQTMMASYSSNIIIEEPSLTVAVHESDGVMACLTSLDNNIVGKAVVDNGIATVNIFEPVADSTALILCISGYNKVTVIDTLTAISGIPYHIFYDSTLNGIVSGPDCAYGGSTVTLTITPDSGFHLSGWVIRDNSNNSISAIDDYGPASPGSHFVMPHGNVTVSAIFAPNASVVLMPVENGTISATPLSSAPGTTVVLSNIPAPGFALNKWTVRRNDDTYTFIEVRDNSFVMPEVDVLVSATFLPTYHIGMATVWNGTVTADHQDALPGTRVSLFAEPDSSYMFDQWIVYRNNNIDSVIALTDNSFVMPESDVTVAALFKYAQTQDDTIGGDNTHTINIPLNAMYAYSISQQIFSPDEVGQAGSISALSLYVDFSNSSSDSRNIDIYISYTDKTEFVSNNDWVAENRTNLYYSGYYTFNVSEWNRIDLDRPFEYDGHSNILITVDDNTGSYACILQFTSHNANANKGLYKEGDSQNFDPESTQVNGNQTFHTNKIIFHKSIDDQGHISLSSNSLYDFYYPTAQGPSEAQGVGIAASNIRGWLRVAAGDNYEVCGEPDGIFSSAILLTPNNGRLRKMVYFRMKADLDDGIYREQAMLHSDNLRTFITLEGQVGNYNSVTPVEMEPLVVFHENNIIINGIGELQIIDIMGRQIAKKTLYEKGTIIPQTLFPCPGVYLIQLNTDNPRRQKIVVR